MNTVVNGFSLGERRQLVADGIRAGKSNRAIARELQVDEGTVRRDRKYLATPERERPAKKERLRKSEVAKPMCRLDDPESLVRHKGRVLKAVTNWIAEQPMVLDEIEHALYEAGKHIVQGRGLVRMPPIPTRRPEQLLLLTRPDPAKWGDFIPNPDYWAEWLARWLVVCMPAQDKFYDEILQETSLWARDRAPRFVY